MGTVLSQSQMFKEGVNNEIIIEEEDSKVNQDLEANGTGE